NCWPDNTGRRSAISRAGSSASFHIGPTIGSLAVRVSPCSGCETGHPSPPFALRSGDNLYVPRTP
ncbi:MAG: hypothetical protein, partial [Olavius algarvensis Gamma 1 endosymbiont]